MCMLCRSVCGEGAGLRSGETEESCCRVVPDPAGEVFHTSFAFTSPIGSSGQACSHVSIKSNSIQYVFNVYHNPMISYKVLVDDLLSQRLKWLEASGTSWITSIVCCLSLSLSISTQPERSVRGQLGLWGHDGHSRNHRRLHRLLRTNPLLEAKPRQLIAFTSFFFLKLEWPPLGSTFFLYS